MPTEHRFYLFADVETTDLNPWKGSKLLEVAMILTDLDLTELSRFHARVHYSPPKLEAMREEMVPYVRTMHQESGLWDELIAGYGTYRADVDGNAARWLETYVERGEAHMAGNSLRLDLNHFEKWLPLTYEWVSYRSLDLTGMSLALEQWAGLSDTRSPKPPQHRALADVEDSLAQARKIRDFLIRP